MKNFTILFLALITLCVFEMQAQSIEKLNMDAINHSVEGLNPFIEVEDGVYIMPVTQKINVPSNDDNLKTVEEEGCFDSTCQVADVDADFNFGIVTSRLGQSFVACQTGVVTELSLKVWFYSSQERVVDLYFGENQPGLIPGEPLLSNIVNEGGMSFYDNITYDLSKNPFPVTEGVSYRFEFQKISGSFQVGGGSSNPYADGALYVYGNVFFDGQRDVNFEIVIEETKPVPVFSGEMVYCEEEDFPVIEVDEWETYLWSNGATTQNIEAEQGVYFVTVSNEDGCTTTGSVEIVSNPKPVAEISISENICPGDDITLEGIGEGVTEWQWSGPNEFSSIKESVTLEEASVDDSGIYYLTVFNEYGCTTTIEIELEVPEVFSFDLENPTQTQTATGMNVYAVELCGGTMPYSVDIESEGGFASSNLLPSGNAGCQLLQITYGSGISWTATITDANECSDAESVIQSDDLGGIPLLMIEDFEMTKETCVGKKDGALTVNVSGGDDACGNYSYKWQGPNVDLTNSGGTTGNSISGLGGGTYNVTVTDCEGNTTVGTQNVTRAGIGCPGGRGGRGNKAAINEHSILSLQAVPNPFSHTTAIRLQMNESEHIRLTLYRIDGSLQAELFNGVVEAEQQNEFTLSSENLNTGMYILHLQTQSGEMHQEKLLLTK